MSAHIWPSPAAGAPAVAPPFRLRVAGVLLVLSLASCTDAPRSPVAGPDPIDPEARVPRVDYRSTIGSYESQRPVSPRPHEQSWREQNEQVSPAPKSGQ